MNARRDLLRLLAAMPFLDRLEMVAVSGWSRGAVYGAVARLEQEGLLDAVPHASDLTPPTRRYCLTAGGLQSLATDGGSSVEALLRRRPVSEQWRRILLQRLDALATIYRLASAVSDAAYPIRLRWYRAMPMDAALALPGGRTLAVVRLGHTADRTAFAKRLWRLRGGPRPGAFLLVVPDEVRLRHTGRLMAGAPATTFLACERDVAASGPDAQLWRSRAGSPLLSLREVLAHVAGGKSWPRERPLQRVSLPRALPQADAGTAPDWLLPASLGRAGKRVLDLVADWPWIAPSHLASLLDVSERRLGQVVRPLEEAGLVARKAGRRLVLTDRGLAVLARRDRASVGLARKRWSAAPIDPALPFSWRNITGRRNRQLLRNLEHTAAVHEFVAAVSRQARALGWEVVQIDPPHRASRYFRYAYKLHSVHPDAFGALRKDSQSWLFFLEWERRAVRPVTMAARLAPYLRYYASPRPTDDHGVRPAVLVAFEDELAAGHFLQLALREVRQAGAPVPLSVSHQQLLRTGMPLGQAWLSPGEGWELQTCLPQ